jgi:hypothetical protein
MTTLSHKENLVPNAKLMIGDKSFIPRIHLERLRSIENSPKNYSESFVSINLMTSKSPTYRENVLKSSETIMESASIQRGIFCNACSLGQNDCRIV